MLLIIKIKGKTMKKIIKSTKGQLPSFQGTLAGSWAEASTSYSSGVRIQQIRRQYHHPLLLGE